MLTHVYGTTPTLEVGRKVENHRQKIAEIPQVDRMNQTRPRQPSFPFTHLVDSLLSHQPEVRVFFFTRDYTDGILLQNG